jgi:hypothetical protein
MQREEREVKREKDEIPVIGITVMCLLMTCDLEDHARELEFATRGLACSV